MDMSLIKLREMATDREAWHAAVHWDTNSQNWLTDWTTTLNKQKWLVIKICKNYKYKIESVHGRPQGIYLFIYFCITEI